MGRSRQRRDRTVEARRGFFPVVHGESVSVSQGYATVAASGADLRLEQGGAQLVAAANDLSVRQGGGLVMAAGNRLSVEEGGGLLLAARDARVTGSTIGLLVAGAAQLDDVRVVLSPGASVLAAAGVGVVVGVALSQVVGRRRRRRRAARDAD